MPEYQDRKATHVEGVICKLPVPVYFLPGFKDDGGESQACQLAGVPGLKATQGEGVMCKLIEPVSFLPGLKDDGGESQADQLAGIPGRKTAHV